MAVLGDALGASWGPGCGEASCTPLGGLPGASWRPSQNHAHVYGTDRSPRAHHGRIHCCMPPYASSAPREHCVRRRGTAPQLLPSPAPLSPRSSSDCNTCCARPGSAWAAVLRPRVLASSHLPRTGLPACTNATVRGWMLLRGAGLDRATHDLVPPGGRLILRVGQAGAVAEAAV